MAMWGLTIRLLLLRKKFQTKLWFLRRRAPVQGSSPRAQFLPHPHVELDAVSRTMVMNKVKVLRARVGLGFQGHR